MTTGLLLKPLATAMASTVSTPLVAVILKGTVYFVELVVGVVPLVVKKCWLPSSYRIG